MTESYQERNVQRTFQYSVVCVLDYFLVHEKEGKDLVDWWDVEVPGIFACLQGSNECVVDGLYVVVLHQGVEVSRVPEQAEHVNDTAGALFRVLVVNLVLREQTSFLLDLDKFLHVGRDLQEQKRGSTLISKTLAIPRTAYSGCETHPGRIGRSPRAAAWLPRARPGRPLEVPPTAGTQALILATRWTWTRPGYLSSTSFSSMATRHRGAVCVARWIWQLAGAHLSPLAPFFVTRAQLCRQVFVSLANQVLRLPQQVARDFSARRCGLRMEEGLGKNWPWDPLQHSPIVISGNRGGPKSGWPDRESKPDPPECESALSWPSINSRATVTGRGAVLVEKKDSEVLAGAPRLVARQMCYTLISYSRPMWDPGRGGIVDRLLASHLGEPDSITGGFTPEYPHVGIVLGDAIGRWVFLGISRFPRPCIPALLHFHHFSSSLVLKITILRAAQISRLQSTSKSTTPLTARPRVVLLPPTSARLYYLPGRDRHPIDCSLRRAEVPLQQNPKADPADVKKLHLDTFGPLRAVT
ncbi:hypothetical protein PR048_006615 [Dryococelus australis]|uniref:Uncharacterized protein n=1 Tax=Dryococelus australis TaxID=614101 RepID=A0ABQ9IC45_9NEOP|nr:hypothetical protein PR048_006615 [Dryococelus australis]